MTKRDLSRNIIDVTKIENIAERNLDFTLEFIKNILIARYEYRKGEIKPYEIDEERIPTNYARYAR